MKKRLGFIIVPLIIFIAVFACVGISKIVKINNTPTVKSDSGTIEEKSKKNTENTEVIGKSKGKIVVIDAGHQEQANNGKEPIGPGSNKYKPKVSSGTSGIVSGLNEYELNLIIAKKLKSELEYRNYKVIMVRNSNNVNISNAKRAQIANEADADAFIRIHANGSENKNINGTMTICQTPNNPYNSSLYKKSKMLSTYILEEIIKNTNNRNKGVMETDEMSGINWCQVPVTIVEVGYMSNPEEDKLLSMDSFQDKIAKSIADGVDRFFL